VDDRLRHYRHISYESPSHNLIVGLSTRVGEQPYCNSTCFLDVNPSLQLLDYIITLAVFRTLICHTCSLGSVVRALFKVGDCRFCYKRCAFALVAIARLHFLNLNLRNPNHFFSRAMIDCFREAESLLLIGCANESFFAKTIQLLKTLDAGPFEMRLQNG
jgi:hypothetical protein